MECSTDAFDKFDPAAAHGGRIGGPRVEAPVRPARMIDVARLAGVSLQTVSRVVNGEENVTPAIRDRVEDAITTLRYRRNTVARALATKRTMRLGLLTYALSVTSPSLALLGISEEARRYGYSTNLVTLPDVTPESITAGLRELWEDAVDGILVLAPMTEVRAEIRRANPPVPLVSFEQGGASGPGVIGIDEVLAGQLATRHLVGLGHRAIDFVAGPAGWAATSARETGWRRELKLLGLPPREPIRAVDWSPESGYRAGIALADRGDTSAVIVSSDPMAIGTLAAFHDRGLRVPEDVSVVSFDDMPEARYLRPALTTVKLDFITTGRLAVRRLLELLDVPGVEPVDENLLIPLLVERDSTAPARS